MRSTSPRVGLICATPRPVNLPACPFFHAAARPLSLFHSAPPAPPAPSCSSCFILVYSAPPGEKDAVMETVCICPMETLTVRKLLEVLKDGVVDWVTALEPALVHCKV